MERDNVFQMAAANIRCGAGCTSEVGMDLRDLGAKRMMVLVDPQLVDLPAARVVFGSLRSQRIEHTVFDEVAVEPTDASFQHAAQVATDERFDAFVAVGGGSTIDTAKAANLYATYPADFLHYVNAPIGGGQPVPGPLRPVIADRRADHGGHGK